MHSPIDEDDYKRAMEAIERLKQRRAEARKQDIERRYGKPKLTRQAQYDIIDLEKMWLLPSREGYWPGR